MLNVVQDFLGARANTERCHLTLAGSVLCGRILYILRRGDAKHRPAFFCYSWYGYGHASIVCCLLRLQWTLKESEGPHLRRRSYSEIIPGILLTLLYQFTTSSGESQAILTVAET